MHQGCTFPTSPISPSLPSNASYTQFTSSEKGVGGFCRVCGSLPFSYVGDGKMEIPFGTIDEDMLKSKVGTELCLSNNNI